MKQAYLAIVLLVLLGGCATAQVAKVVAPPQAIPALDGSYYRVQRGDTLWRIARSFGLDVKTLAGVNRVPNASRLEVGQNLFIPLPKGTGRFLWPALGRHQSAGAKGLKIAVAAGSLVRASRSGRVAVATRELAGWGQTVVLDHGDGYVTIYSGLEELLASPGSVVAQGRPVGRAGPRGLHFKIRRGTLSKDPLALLP